jgi:alpha-mannosidase
MVERLTRMKNTLDLPHAEFGHVSSFFKELEKVEDRLPTYQGEMYLENHVGTYTSQALNKQNNRHLEEKLRAVEMLLAERGITRYDEEMKKIWKEVLAISVPRLPSRE